MASSSSSSSLDCLLFSLAEIKLATETFSEEYVIGEGGFGKVYACSLEISGRPTPVAVKRLSEDSQQGTAEFEKEIETLGKIRHRNIVSLFGYCKEEGHMLLVYEFMPNQTLRYHLRKGSLTWKQRLRILIGVGYGLHHLHYGFQTGNSIVHRDVKSSNILLDKNFVGKVSDFGLARILPVDKSQEYTRDTNISKGYADPYFVISCGSVMKESDTYSFGVVLLEALTGKLAIYKGGDNRTTCHSVWASKKKPDDIEDLNVIGDKMSEESLLLCHDVVQRCLDTKEPHQRPSMTYVVAQLELALKCLEPLIHSGTDDDHINHMHVEFNMLLQDALGHEEAVDLPLPDIPFQEEEEEAMENNQSVDMQPIVAPDHIVNMLSAHDIPEFALADFDLTTDHFSDQYLISRVLRGGTVFRGAVKKLDKELPHHEFIAQVTRVYSLKHANVVKLFGYCLDGDVRMLVHEFTSRGSLHGFLYGRQGLETLSWAQRVKIAVGIATGLRYIHENGLIHHNINSNNVLLFDDEVAKLTCLDPSAQRSCSCKIPSCDEHPCLPLNRGYHSRKFGLNGRSQKDDVYGFGIILLQLMTGYKVFDDRCGGKSLVRWATPMLTNDDKVQTIVDAVLRGNYPSKTFAKVASVAAMCLERIADRRPNMTIVVSILRIASRETQNYLRYRNAVPE